MYRTALAWAYPSRSRSSANASMCGPLIPARNRWSVLGAEKYFSSMGFSLLSIGHGRPHQRSRSPELMVSRRPPIRSKRLPSPPILAPDSPEANTPHNASNGVHPITCRNRHCPKCQNTERAKWLQSRQAELLPVEYFHVVFTVP